MTNSATHTKVKYIIDHVATILMKVEVPTKNPASYCKRVKRIMRLKNTSGLHVKVTSQAHYCPDGEFHFNYSIFNNSSLLMDCETDEDLAAQVIAWAQA